MNTKTLSNVSESRTDALGGIHDQSCDYCGFRMSEVRVDGALLCGECYAHVVSRIVRGVDGLAKHEAKSA